MSNCCVCGVECENPNGLFVVYCSEECVEEDEKIYDEEVDKARE